MEIVAKDLQLVWEEFCQSLRDYPTEPADLRKLWGKFVRLMGYLSEERACLKRTLSEATMKKDGSEYVEQLRFLSRVGTSFEERKKYRLLYAPESERQAQIALDEVESMIDSMYRVERILQGYHRIMALDMKLSFEGHE